MILQKFWKKINYESILFQDVEALYKIAITFHIS